MGIIEKLLKKEKTDVVEEIGVKTKLPDINFEKVDEYYINEPYSKINIFKSKDLSEELYYYSIEDPLNDTENDTYEKLMKIMSKELEPPTEEGISPRKYVLEQAENLVKKYERSLGKYDE